MERASDMIWKIWVICSEGGGVEGILSFLFFSFFARGKTRQDTVSIFPKSRTGNGKVYLHLPTCPLPYLTLHIDTYILLMTPKYVSLTSKFSIFVGVRVD